MRADLSGFFAVVNAIEQINRTINVFSIGLSNLEKFGNLLQKQSQQQPKRFGFPSTIQVRNLQIKTGSVVLNASSVIVQTQKKLSTPLQKPSIVKNTPKQEKSKTVTNVQSDNLATKPQKETTIKKPRKSGGDSAPSHVAKKTAARKNESAKDQFQVLFQKNNTALAKAISEHLSGVVLTVKVIEFPHKKSDNADLAKAISQQLSKVTFKTSERSNFIKNLTTGFTYGIGGTLGQRFTSGFEQGTGINSRFLGKQTGKAARYPFVLVNEFKKGFFDEDTQLNFKDKEDPDENTGNSSSSPPKKPSGGSGGTNKKTFGNNLLERFIYQEGQKFSNKFNRKDAVHAFIDAWAEWSKEKNLRFAIPQFIEKMRQKSDKETFSDKEINKTLEKRKDFLKEEIAKEEKLPDNQKIKINETRQKKQLLSPKEQLAYIEFLEKHRKDLYQKLGKILFRFRGQNKLKFEELMAIYYYTEAQGYKEMNQVLREQSKPLAENLGIKEKNLISSADKNIKVATSGLNRLPGFKGKTYRGLDFATMGIDPNEYYKVGQIIEEKGFTSTTKNQTMRYPGNVVWEINAKKGGKDISEIEAFTNEEVLFPPNSKFKVVGKRQVKKFGRDFWVIELDDVNNETANFPDVQGDFEKNQAQNQAQNQAKTSASSVKTPQPQRRTRKRQSANIPSVELQIKPNEPDQIPTKQDIVETPDKVQQETKPNDQLDQVPTRTDTPGRPDGSGNQPPDRSPDIVPVGPVELPIGPRNNVDIEAEPTRGGGLAPLAGQLDTYQKTLRESLARGLEVKKAQTDIEIEPGLWVDVEQLNQGFVKRTQTQLILFWEKLRTNLGKEINRTLAGLLGTIPGAMLGRGLTGDPVGGYLGGMAGRLIAETGFQDVSNFRSLQEQGMSPATAEFWQQFGNNRKFLPNTLRKTAVGYVTGSVVGRGINDVMQATGANQLISALMPSWLETAIGDGINRTIKTIADPNIDLAIPHLPPAANKILSAPLHAVGKSVAAQGFLGNMGLSFLDHQTKTALMPVREALMGAGQALGGEGLLGEYLGDRFTGLGIGAIQDTAKASGRGVAGMIAPGLPAEVRNFIADQVIKQGVLDGTVRGQVAPFLASRAGTDVFARGVKVPITGKIAGTINQTLDKYDPFAIAPKQLLTDEQILLNREQRLTKKRTTAINAVESLFNRIDKSVDQTTKAVVGIGNGFLGFFDNIRTKTYDFAKKTAGLTDNPVTLIDQYFVYLDQLVQDAQKQAEETVKGIIPNYKNLTIPERKEAIGSYKKKVATEVKKFRMAIEDGESQIALEIGENILALVESTRKIYKDLLEAVPSDLSGTKSIEANQRYLTSVQTEVLKGQPNLKGRAKTGLMQLVGTETSEGFIKGIEERLNKVRNSGKELAESAIEGAKKRLGIQSPSKVFEEIGEQVVEGFKRGVGEVKEVLQEPVEQTLQATEKVLDNFASSAQNAFDKFYEALAEKFPIIKEFKDIILGFIATVAVGNVFQFLVNVITKLANASFTAVVELESVRTALIAVTGSAEKGAKGLAFVREEAQKLGVNLQTLENAYAGFIAVTRYTPLQGKQADQIFSAFTQTAALRGLSNEEQSRMFQAINQIISKRKLSAEEVRGQLGEIPGLAFESTLARSLGVAPAQLTDMMKDGLLFAEDIIPKVAAIYQSENAAIQGSTETTIQAVNRFQNAITNLQRGFESWITGAQIFFNLFAAGIENLSKIIPGIVKYLGIFWAALFIDLAQITINLGKLFASFKSGGVLFKNFAQVAVQAFAAIKTALVKFLIQFGLITLAVDAVGAAIYVLSNNAFPELKKGIEETTKGANQLKKALQDVGKATQTIPKEFPKTEEEIVTSRNWNIFGWDTGFNLEGTRQFLNNIDKALGFEPMLTTVGQQELSNFQENVGGLLSQVDSNLMEQFNVEKTIKEIRELDKELAKARSRQFNIPAGDKKRYEAAIKEQQKLIEEIDKRFNVTASFETQLQNNKAEIEKQLKALDELMARPKPGITEEAAKALRAQLEQRLQDIDKTSTAFNDLMSNLQKSVNALTLALRNLNEQATYFNETLQRNATNARVQFIRRARAAGLGSQVRDLGLEEIEQNTLEARIVFLRDQLGAVNELLTKPDFADVLTDLRQQAEDMGFNLENTATIDRLISENRSQQETAVLNTLKEQLRLQDELGQAEENLEQSISSTRSGIRDLNNSVEEFFFNLTQRIDEAIVEVDRILNKLKYTDIKNRLQRALVPGSNTFVNGLVNQIQEIFDRASGIVEQLLGQRSARINFVGERRGLQVELENFTRNLGGATEALELFRQGLLGTQPSGVGGGQGSASGRFAIGTVGATGIGTGAHLDIRGKDRQGNRLPESRLRELLSLVVVGGKPLSEQLDKITSGYGHRRPPTRGASSFHPALDFGFSRGTPIEFTGQAVSARTFFDKGGGGNVVEITLPNGEKLQLLHLDSVANLGTIQRGRVNTPGNTTGNTQRRGMPNVPFASLIEGAARQYGLDPLLFAALIKKESGFRQEKSPGQILTSSAGAVGIAQLKRDTARELGVNPDKVAENLIGGAEYLAKMLKRFGGNIELALSAYKAGPGNIRNGQVMAAGTVRDVAIVMQYYREFQQQMAKSAGQAATANQPAALAIPKQIQSVLVQEVGGKTVFSKNASTPPASPASTIKLIVADILSKEIKKGTIGLKDQITIKQPLVDPHGTLKSGNRRTVQELIDLMLRVSDNTATNVLIDLMGGLQSVTNKAQQSGYTATTLSRYLNIPGSGPANRSNAVDTTRAMQAILSDNSEAGQLAEKSIRQTRNFKFSGEVGGKIGNNSKVIGNVGIVSINGKEYIVTAYANVDGNVLSNRGIITNATNLITSSLSASPTPSAAPTPPTAPTAPIPNVNNVAAEGLTNRLIQIKENQINLGDAGVRQEIEGFLIELQQTQQEILRQMDDSIRESTQSIINTRNNVEDIFKQYSPQTQSAQLETELRGVENQFRDLDNQLFEQERGLTDNIQGLDKLLGQMKPILEILSASTNQVDQESASFLMGLIGRLEQDKATYSGMRSQIQQLRGQLKEGQIDAENFVKAQAKLRTIQSDLERIGTELSIAQEQNNLEQERAIALLQSRQQLELDLLQIAQDFEGEDRDKRLTLAKEQARLREREIEYQFQSKTLSQETELISQRLAIAQSLSNLGKINELELLQSQKQLEQEILEIKKQYPDLADQERRINLAKEQARLREIGIENNFYNQRWQRQQELFDSESRITEARAARLERFGQPFEAAAMREELAFRAELLRYEQEIEAIRQRYTDPADEQTRDELIRNAGILLELNLEQIDQQFKDLGETIRDTVSGPFATFLEDTLTGTKSISDAFLDMTQSILKSLAQISARMAIGGLFRLFKIPIPGFADGGTVYPEPSRRVPNFAEGDTVKFATFADLPFGNAQGNPFKGIQEALRKEGPQGVLAVFTPGEEILSLRTGEAQRYQRLKTQLGKNPLAKIGNFADGGTIGINESLLAGLNYGMPTAGRLPNNFGQTTQISNYGGDRSVTVNVTAPNPSAFNASERQIARTIAEYLSRV